MLKCKKCKNPADALSPEDECFECSTGDNLACEVNAANIRDSFKNITDSLARKTGDLGTGVRKSMAKALKDKAN